MMANINNVNFIEECACPMREVGPDLGGTCYGQLFTFMFIIRKFIQGRCELVDPCRRFPPDKQPDDSYDFIVIGGGTAGPVVAARLSANPQWKVLVLEAGGDESPITSVPAWITATWWRNDTDWNYYTEPQEKACLSNDDNKCYWPRAKMLGGSAAINGMMYMRGHAENYDGWAAGGATGWGWRDVLPFFLMSEDNKQIGTLVSKHHHNRGGPMPVQQFRHAPKLAHDMVAASIEMGFPPTSDLNGDNTSGFTIAQTFNDNGSRYTTSRGYLRPVSYRKNLHVVMNAHVSKVIIDPLTKKTTGVEYIDLKTGQKKIVKVKKEAILSAGTLNTPQILLLSGVGPQQTLDKFNIPTLVDLPGVGQNLQNHVGVDLKFTLTKDPDVNQLNWATAMEYLLQREGPLSSTGMSQLTGMAKSTLNPPGDTSPDMQFFFRGYEADCGDGEVQELASIKEKREFGISAVNLKPRSRGFISIKSVDPLEPPLMQPNYLYDDQDVQVLMEAARMGYKLANTTILQTKYGMQPLEDYALDCGSVEGLTEEYLRCLISHHTAPENHQVGTAKMGPKTDPMAVVDTELKVHGVEGLRVIDGSIMPTLNTGNTMAPIVMIAERGANFIIMRHQRSKSKPEFGNRFGDDTPGNPASAQSNEGDRENWNFDNYDSSQKDDKLTDQDNGRWGGWPMWGHGDRGGQDKPWDHKQWHHWDKNRPLQHEPEWNRKHDQYRSRR